MDRIVVVLIALVAVYVGAEFVSIQQGYYCNGKRDCEQLAIILRDCPDLQATDEVPSWVSDNDLELTGEINDRQDSNLRP